MKLVKHAYNEHFSYYMISKVFVIKIFLYGKKAAQAGRNA